MAVLKLFASNPKDGTATFDRVAFYEADDGEGTGSVLLQSVTIDTATNDLATPGYTTHTHPSGSTDKYYAVAYLTADNAESELSPWVKGGQDRWDDLFLKEMDDSTAEVFDATIRELWKNGALEALFPELYRESIDVSLTIEEDEDGTIAQTYPLPTGVFEVLEVGLGDIDSGKFRTLTADSWRVEGELLRLNKLSGVSDGDVLRLVVHKKFMDVGEVPLRLDPVVMLHLKASSYAWMSKSYPRFEKWAQLQVGTKVSFEALLQESRALYKDFEVAKVRLSRLGSTQEY